jgi:hypothetical protein
LERLVMASPVNKLSATELLAALQALDASALVSVMPTSAGTGSAIGCVVPIHDWYFTGRVDHPGFLGG